MLTELSEYTTIFSKPIQALFPEFIHFSSSDLMFSTAYFLMANNFCNTYLTVVV